MANYSENDNDDVLFKLISKTTEWNSPKNKKDCIIYRAKVSDHGIKMILVSETLFASLVLLRESQKFRIELNSEQLIRLINSEEILIEDLVRLKNVNLFHYEIDDFTDFNSDSDFETVEVLTGQSIPTLIRSIYEKHQNVFNLLVASGCVIKACDQFDYFVKIRKGLRYLLKIETGFLNLKWLDKGILEYLKKEAPKRVEYFIDLIKRADKQR